MFGISGGEYLLILIVAIAVIPAKDWPDVARWLARVVKFVRDLIWKISDSANEMREKVDIEKPIAELSQKTMDDVVAAFSTPLARKKPQRAKSKPRVPRKSEMFVGGQQRAKK